MCTRTKQARTCKLALTLALITSSLHSHFFIMWDEIVIGAAGLARSATTLHMLHVALWDLRAASPSTA